MCQEHGDPKQTSLYKHCYFSDTPFLHILWKMIKCNEPKCIGDIVDYISEQDNWKKVIKVQLFE